MPVESEIMHFESVREWISWLEANHSRSDGIWLRIGKIKKGIVSVSYAEALETAICYGWIDALKKSYDQVSWIQRFTPRKHGSKWSEINREKAEILIKNGLMKPSGMAVIETAKKNGAWERAYEPQSSILIPHDLEAELMKKSERRNFFESLDSHNRYAILHRIQTAVKPETREKRIKMFVEMLDAKKKLH